MTVSPSRRGNGPDARNRGGHRRVVARSDRGRAPGDEDRLLLRYDAAVGAARYVRAVSRMRHLARSYGLDLLDRARSRSGPRSRSRCGGDAVNAPRSPLWFAVPAIAVMVLPLLARRRWPFAAPAAVWLLAAALSFVGRAADPVHRQRSWSLGMAPSFLLGNLRDARQARLGLAVVLGGGGDRRLQPPGPHGRRPRLHPLLFAIAWLAGFALRERAEQAEAAEERASQAEREREAARPASPSRRSGHASRASCTTSSRTPSA